MTKKESNKKEKKNISKNEEESKSKDNDNKVNENSSNNQEDLKDNLEEVEVTDTKDQVDEDELEETDSKKIDESRSGVTKYLIIGLLIILCFIIVFKFFIIPSEPVVPVVNSEDKFVYNDFEFEKKDGIWTTVVQSGIQQYEVAFRYSPLEVENISVSGDLRSAINRDKIYVAFNPETHSPNVTMANAEIVMKLAVNFGIAPIAACTVDDQGCIDAGAEIVNCNSERSLPIIELNQVKKPEVIVKDSCVLINGQGEDLVRSANRFMYELFGIMKEGAKATVQ